MSLKHFIIVYYSFTWNTMSVQISVLEFKTSFKVNYFWILKHLFIFTYMFVYYAIKQLYDTIFKIVE